MTISEIKLSGITLYLSPLEKNCPAGRREVECCAVEALVCHVFGPDARYGHDEHGAPVVSGSSAFISVSHCADMVLLAVRAGGPVGADIELPRAQLERIAPKFLTQEEHLRYTTGRDVLLRLWTAKEAVFKAAGEPELTVSRISVNLESGEAVIPSGRTFKVEFIESASHIIAVATGIK